MVTHCSLQAKARVLFGEESRLPCFCLLCILSSLLRMVFHLQPLQATMKDWLLCELGIAVNFLNLKVNKLNILGYLLVTTRFSASLHCNSTLGTRGFSRVRREFSVLAEGQHIFGRRPKPWEKPLARSGAFYCPRWPLSFFIGLHLRQSDWKSPTVIMWAGTWRSVQRPRGGHLGIFWVGMCRPGLQIGTPF